eukprot:6244162-Amphidinium_carterae.1
MVRRTGECHSIGHRAAHGGCRMRVEALCNVQEFMQHQFSVLARESVPRIFAFSGAGGKERYWEDCQVP